MTISVLFCFGLVFVLFLYFLQLEEITFYFYFMESFEHGCKLTFANTFTYLLKQSHNYSFDNMVNHVDYF